MTLIMYNGDSVEFKPIKKKKKKNQMEIFAHTIFELKFSKKIIEEMKRSIGIQAPFCKAIHIIYYVVQRCSEFANKRG